VTWVRFIRASTTPSLPVFFSAQEPGDTAAAHADPRRGGTPGAKSTTRTTEIMRQAVLLVRSYLPGGGGSSSGKDCFSIGPIIFLTVWHAAIENKYIFVAVENIDIFYSFFYWGVFLTGPSKIAKFIFIGLYGNNCQKSLPPKVTVVESCSIFGGQVIIVESHSIFTGDPKPLKIIIFLTKTIKSNIYFQSIIFDN
jgi:hypothetical protein